MTMPSDELRCAPSNVLMVHLLLLNLSSSLSRPACRGKNNVQLEQTGAAPSESFKFSLNISLFYPYVSALFLCCHVLSLLHLHLKFVHCFLETCSENNTLLLSSFCVFDLANHESQ